VFAGTLKRKEPTGAERERGEGLLGTEHPGVHPSLFLSLHSLVGSAYPRDASVLRCTGIPFSLLGPEPTKKNKDTRPESKSKLQRLIPLKLE